MAFGLFALTVLVIAVCCLHFRKYAWGVACSVTGLVLTCLTGFFWIKMLVESGKDSTLLGFHRYPAALVILGMLFLAAFVLILVSAHGVAMRKKRTA